MLGTGGILALSKIKKGTEFIEELAEKVQRNLPSLIRKLKVKPAYLPNRIIWSKADKTITVVGRWKDELELLFKELGDTDLNIYMLSGKFDNPGGFNMLSINDFGKIADDLAEKGIKVGTVAFDDYIWKKFNEPWLETALQRGDDILLWSDPTKTTNLSKLFVIDKLKGPTFYNRELKFLKENSLKYGYDFEKGIKTGNFIK